MMSIGEKISSKAKIRILIILVIAVIGVIWFMNRTGGDLVLKGSVETTMYSHVAEVSGKILEAPAELGTEVKKGDLLFKIDSTDQEYAIEQLEQTLIQGKAALQLLKKGTDAEAIKQAENNVSTAQASYNKVSDEYKSTKELYSEGAVSKDSFDSAEYQYQAARNQLDSAKQQLKAAEDGADTETIVSAEAAVAKTESQIAQMRADLKKYTITANCSGTLMSKNYSVGDMVASGYNLADIAAADEKLIIVYVPVDDIDLVGYGQEVKVRTDKGDYKGTVAYIDVQSEYTPKDLQTSANKNRESFKVKIKIGSDVPLKPGQKADVTITKQ
jgi:HlyD family secretion protein